MSDEDLGFTDVDDPADLEEDTIEDCECRGHQTRHAKCTCSLYCPEPCELRR